MPQLFEKIQRAEFAEFPDWFSENVKDLLSNILVADPTQRSTIAELKSHPWVLENMRVLANTKGRPASQSQEIMEKYPPGHIAEMHSRFIYVYIYMVYVYMMYACICIIYVFWDFLILIINVRILLV
jgi:hypothetical protein